MLGGLEVTKKRFHQSVSPFFSKYTMAEWKLRTVSAPASEMHPNPAQEPQTRRRRVATFSFKGVVAARNRDQARAMRNAVEHMCTTIIDTYRVCMDQAKTTEDKSSKLQEIVAVEPDLKFILGFVREEANACKVERVKVQMLQLASKIEPQIYALLDEVRLLLVVSAA